MLQRNFCLFMASVCWLLAIVGLIYAAATASWPVLIFALVLIACGLINWMNANG